MGSRLFREHPPFPDDVSAADVRKFSLAKLSLDDGASSRELFQVCRNVGFFLLDLEGDMVGDRLLEDIEALYSIAKDTFELEAVEKTKYKQDASKGNFLGWKQVGIMKTDNGAPDRCEFYAISQDEMLGNIPARPHPITIESQRSRVSSFLKHAHSIITRILSILSIHLALAQGTLASLMRPTHTSGSLLRLIRYAAQPEGDRRTSLLSHTDMGTITLLCSVLGGLQILAPGGNPAEEADWRYVRPEPNCAVVDIGDALVEWSGGVLRSNMHRVTYAPGEQAKCTRYNMAYLVRENKSVSMKRLRSERIPSAEDDDEQELEISCEEWELSKSKALTAGADCARSRGGREIRPLTAAVGA